MSNIFFDGITGDFITDDIEIVETSNSYKVTFANGYSVNFGDSVRLVCYDSKNRSTLFTLEQLQMFFGNSLSVPNCSVLEQYWGMTEEERENLLEYMLGVSGHSNNYLTEDDLVVINDSRPDLSYTFNDVEKLVNSLGYATGMFKATRKNRSGRFTSEKIDAIRFSKEVRRVIKSVVSVNEKGYNFIRKSGEPKLLVCSGITLVPFYI